MWKIIAKMKPNKSPGYDEIPVELIKCAPETIYEQLVGIYNTMTETGDTPREIAYGILKPLQNPNKMKSPPSTDYPPLLSL